MSTSLESLSEVASSSLSEDERRFLFRELAKLVLDPAGDEELTICDNDGNVLGFFDPVVHRMKAQGHSAPTASTAEKFLSGAKPAEEVFAGALDTDRDAATHQ